MDLFYLEHKKLWRKGSTKICVLLCFSYVVIFGSILNYSWISFGSSHDYKSAFGNDFDGYSNIRNCQEYAKKAGGELTEEALQQLVRDYQEIMAAGKREELKKTDWSTVERWLGTLYPELERKSSDIYHLMIEYVEPEMLTGIYEKQEQAIENFLEASGQTGKERDYLLNMNEKVKLPFRYEWTNGWSIILASTLDGLGMLMALFLAIVLSAVFAGEWHNNMGSLTLTMKNGWQKIACAKIGSGMLFALELFLLLFVGNVIAQICYLGTDGWDMPIQNIKMIAVAPMNMLQAEIYEYAFLLLGAIGYAGIVMLISASVKNHAAALLLSLAVIYAPMMIAQYLPLELQKALDLIPLAGSAADIFRTNTFHLFGRYIWSPYLLITVPVLIGIFCIPFAIKKWARKLKG